MPEEVVIKADKTVRRLVLLACLVCVLVGVALAGWVLPWSQGRLEQVEPEAALRIVQTVVALIFLSIIPFCVYLCRFGRRAIKYQQMPPPGTKVIADTKVIEGDKAVVRGRAVMVIAFVLAVLGLVGGLYVPYMLGRAFGQETRQTVSETKLSNSVQAGQAPNSEAAE
ncbi:MAG: hypothetical protein PVJ86_04970 [Phycisphaerales bacterium]|jgi:hypothetical protein